MKTKILVGIAVILSSFVTLLWILGLIFADINLFILAMIVLIISLYPAIKYYKELDDYFSTRNGEVIDDERKDFINNKAGIASYGTLMVLIIYSGVAIFTLRNIYPEYVIISYTLFILVIIGFIAYGISSIYYKRKYGN